MWCIMYIIRFMMTCQFSINGEQLTQKGTSYSIATVYNNRYVFNPLLNTHVYCTCWNREKNKLILVR